MNHVHPAWKILKRETTDDWRSFCVILWYTTASMYNLANPKNVAWQDIATALIILSLNYASQHSKHKGKRDCWLAFSLCLSTEAYSLIRLSVRTRNIFNVEFPNENRASTAIYSLYLCSGLLSIKSYNNRVAVTELSAHYFYLHISISELKWYTSLF